VVLRTRPHGEPESGATTQAVFYGVVSGRPRKSSSFSWRAEQATAFISEVEEDESELADELRIEEISLDASAN
jgi:hypothetical protein